jgi:hypothetical protein
MPAVRRIGLAGVIAVIAVLVTGGNAAVAPEHVSGARFVAAVERPPVAPVARDARRSGLFARHGVARARRWARSRAGLVSFAVVDERGRLRGWHMHRAYYSASVSKAMLAVALMRSARSRDLTPGEIATLTPMLTMSDNDAADTVWQTVGAAGLSSVARAAGMEHFDTGYWANVGITAADQARFFSRLNRLTPDRHLPTLRRLMSSVVDWQRWGVPRALGDGTRVFFKGGWRDDLVHQIARIESHRATVALAVLTDRNPPWPYGPATIEGIARRVLR